MINKKSVRKCTLCSRVLGFHEIIYSDEFVEMCKECAIKSVVKMEIENKFKGEIVFCCSLYLEPLDGLPDKIENEEIRDEIVKIIEVLDFLRQ